MAVWKRDNGKRVKGEGPKGNGTWIVEFRLRGHYKLYGGGDRTRALQGAQGRRFSGAAQGP